MSRPAVGPTFLMEAVARDVRGGGQRVVVVGRRLGEGGDRLEGLGRGGRGEGGPRDPVGGRLDDLRLERRRKSTVNRVGRFDVQKFSQIFAPGVLIILFCI